MRLITNKNQLGMKRNIPNNDIYASENDFLRFLESNNTIAVATATRIVILVTNAFLLYFHSAPQPFSAKIFGTMPFLRSSIIPLTTSILSAKTRGTQCMYVDSLYWYAYLRIAPDKPAGGVEVPNTREMPGRSV